MLFERKNWMKLNVIRSNDLVPSASLQHLCYVFIWKFFFVCRPTRITFTSFPFNLSLNFLAPATPSELTLLRSTSIRARARNLQLEPPIRYQIYVTFDTYILHSYIFNFNFSASIKNNVNGMDWFHWLLTENVILSNPTFVFQSTVHGICI
jgi:hypothetical protein